MRCRVARPTRRLCTPLRPPRRCCSDAAASAVAAAASGGADFAPPVVLAQDFLASLHSVCPSWLVVTLAVPWLLRVVITPLVVMSQRSLERDGEKLAYGTRRLLQLQQESAGDPAAFEKRFQQLKQEVGFNPATRQYRPMLVGLAVAPVHMAFFFSFRNMAARFPDWHTGGALWFTALDSPDPTLALPLIVGALTCTQFQILSSTIPGDTPVHRVQRQLFQGIGFGLGVGSVPVMYYLGAGFNCYVASSLACALVQHAVLRSDAARACIGLRPSGWLQRLMEEARRQPAPAQPEEAGTSTAERMDEERIDALLANGAGPLSAADREALLALRRSAGHLSQEQRDSLLRMAQDRAGRGGGEAESARVPLIALQAFGFLAVAATWWTIERERAAGSAQAT
eukprot:TRINITY_DN42462_c0_g1_i1.p1 TRINITY_DN42462_c0_g1~~TRINITY_DN42462_c0_g1_i1.p1  ORF type:complete len:398 (+),score=107.72 TRINITY_DN42462_c0_g1_i1:80-1273(+)